MPMPTTPELSTVPELRHRVGGQAAVLLAAASMPILGSTSIAPQQPAMVALALGPAIVIIGTVGTVAVGLGGVTGRTVASVS